MFILLSNELSLYLLRKRKENPSKNKWLSMLFLSSKHDLVCFKTALYIFFVFVLIFSAILSLDPSIQVSDSFRNYLASMEYGFVLLIAVDALISQFSKDEQRVKKALE